MLLQIIFKVKIKIKAKFIINNSKNSSNSNRKTIMKFK